MPAIEERVAFAVLGRSPASRQLQWARKRGWRHLRFFQVLSEAFVADHGLVRPGFGEVPFDAVWTRADGRVRRFWSDEMTVGDPGQDPRGALDPTPLWAILDLTPAGRGG